MAEHFSWLKGYPLAQPGIKFRGVFCRMSSRGCPA